jgi:hypothetical protein
MASGAAPRLAAKLILTKRSLIVVSLKPLGGAGVFEADLRNVLEARYDGSMMGPSHHSLFVSTRQGDIQFCFGATSRVNAEGARWSSLILDAMHSANAAPEPQVPAPSSSLAEELGALAAMHQSGALSDEEFAAGKRRLLG